MGATVAQLGVAAVKTTRITHPDAVELTSGGVAYDRFLAIVDDHGRRVSAVTEGAPFRVTSVYDPSTATLRLDLAQRTVEAPLELGGPCELPWYPDRVATGRRVAGPFDELLSEAIGRPCGLVRIDDESGSYAPVAIVARASIDAVSPAIDPRMLRMTIVADGCRPFEEDTWIGRDVTIGEAVVRVVRPDPRCNMTTRDPDTGERAFDTLRAIRDIRGQDDDGDLILGVYARVVTPGVVRVGDALTPG